MPPPAIPYKQQSGLEINNRLIYPPPEDNADELLKENYDSLYPLPKPGSYEYYISSTLYVTKYLLARPFHTPHTPQLQPFRYSETPFYYMDHTPQPSIEDNEGSATRKSISVEGTPREQSTASQGGDDNGGIISRGGRKGKSIGKHISEDDELQLFRIRKKHETSYGHKGEKYGMTYFWNLVSRDFVEYRGYLPYSAESCRRRVANKVRQRRADLEKEETGREEGYTD